MNTIPYEKLSKKEKRALDKLRRGSWNGVNPVTKKVESKKQYRRKRAQEWKKDIPFSVPVVFIAAACFIPPPVFPAPALQDYPPPA